MILRETPDDFRVEERTNLRPEAIGSFSFYRLEKRNWTTPEALNVVRRRWKIDLARLSVGGLKDRHAHTIQYFSIFQGPQRNCSDHELKVTFLGRLPRPYQSTDIASNHFTLTLRKLEAGQVSTASEAFREAAEVGVPNYFDDQRFGSVAGGNEFVAKAMVRGEFEQALRLALTAPYPHDRAEEKHSKAILRAHWGHWDDCHAQIKSRTVSPVLQHLVFNPTDFAGALQRLQPELRGLHLSVWQSALWNRMLAKWIEARLDPSRCAKLQLVLGPFPAPRTMPPEFWQAWETLSLPLPSARLKVDPSQAWAPILEEVMAEEGIRLSEMKIRGMRKPFFSKGDRIAMIRPRATKLQCEDDDRHHSCKKLIVEFELPRGAYATLIVKRLLV